MLLKKKQACELLQCSATTLDAHIRARLIVAINIGTAGAKRPTIRITRESIERFIQSRTPETPIARTRRSEWKNPRKWF